MCHRLGDAWTRRWCEHSSRPVPEVQKRWRPHQVKVPELPCRPWKGLTQVDVLVWTVRKARKPTAGPCPMGGHTTHSIHKSALGSGWLPS